MRSNILPFIFLSFVMMTVHSYAQDPHLTQWKENPILLNPAETGRIKDGEMRIFATYRNQWSRFGSGISTTALAFDMKKGKSRIAYGGYLLSSNLSNVFTNTSFVASSSYEITDPSNKKYHINAGLQLGGIYKRFDQTKLTFDNQYSNGNFDSDLPSGENFIVESKMLLESALGFTYYNTNKEKKIKPFSGFSLAHLTRQKVNYSGEMISPTAAKWSLFGGTKIELDKWIIITPYALYMKQGTASEIFGGLALDYRFNVDFSATLDLGYGSFYNGK